MILTTVMPTSGNFVGVWMRNNKGVWSENYMWYKGFLHYYDEVSAKWRIIRGFNKGKVTIPATHFVVG